MVTDTCKTGQSLPIPVSRLIVFRFITIQPFVHNLQSFNWLSFEGASSYIVQLSSSQGKIFRKKVLATNDFIQTYCYEEALLEPRKDYIFTIEIDEQNSYLDYCHTNNEKDIAEYVAQGIKNINNLDLSQIKVNILAQLDSLLIARNELLNIIWGVIRQGSNSEIICFLNYFLAQGSSFKLLANSSHTDDIFNALGEISSQLAAVFFTLGEYLQLSEVQISLVKSLISKGLDIAFFNQNLQLPSQSISFARGASFNSCDSRCRTWINKYPDYEELICSKSYCKGCDFCVGIDP